MSEVATTALLVGRERAVALASQLTECKLRFEIHTSLMGLGERIAEGGVSAVLFVDEGGAPPSPVLIRHVRSMDPVVVVGITCRGSLEEAEARGLWAGADGVLEERAGARWFDVRIAHLASRRRRMQRDRVNRCGPVRVVLAGAEHHLGLPSVMDAVDRRAIQLSYARTPREALVSVHERLTSVVVLEQTALQDQLADVVAALVAFDPDVFVQVVGDPATIGVTQAMLAGAQEALWAPLGRHQLRWALGRAVDAIDTSTQVVASGRVVLVGRRGHATALARRTLMDAGIDAVVIEAEGVPSLPSAVAAARADAVVVWLESTTTEGVAREFVRTIVGIQGVPLLASVVEPTSEAIWRLVALGAYDVLDSTSLARQSLPVRVVAARSRFSEWQKYRLAVSDLQARELGQRSMLERSADGMVVLGPDDRVRYANPAAERLFQSVTGSLTGQLFAWPIVSSKPVVLPPSARCPEGHLVKLSFTEIVWEDSAARLVSVREITDEVRTAALREKLLHTERLAAIGQLAAGITHEINNPASYVFANLVAMQRALRALWESDAQIPPSFEELHQMVSDSLEGMARIREITHDLRTFGRIETDEVERISINSVVETACNIAFNEVRYRAKLVKQLRPVPQVSGAPGKLGQIVTNLLVNAAQAMEEGHAERNQIIVTTGSDSREVWLVVEDTGCGIPADIRTKVFEPFFTTKERGVGTGLGLALCADIIRQHGGSIALHDRQPRGTRVEVRLPIASPLRAVERVKYQATERSRSLRILVIDDEPLVLRGHRRLLREHDVVTVGSGREALELLTRDNRFDLVLCDVMMPEMDGVTVHEQVTASLPALAKRFAFCSGGALSPRARGYLAQSRTPMVDKPIRPESLDRVLLDIDALADELVESGVERGALARDVSA